MTETIRFVGRPGVVEVVVRPRGFCSWRFVGLHRRGFYARGRFKALLAASHACGMSLRAADFRASKSQEGER